MENFQQQKDDVLVAISEGVLDPAAEHLPMVVLRAKSEDQVEVLVDGELHKTVDAGMVFNAPIRQLARRLRLNSEAVEIRPSDPTHRVGVLLPPHIAFLPLKAIWQRKGRRNTCLLVLEYLPLKQTTKVVTLRWGYSDEDVQVEEKYLRIDNFYRLVKKGRVQTFFPDPGRVPRKLIEELKRYGADTSTLR